MTNPETWGTLVEALNGKEKYSMSGVGFVFTVESGVIGIDIDHCLDESGSPNAVAAEILEKLPLTYIEKSPSGRGLHVFLFGSLPDVGNRNMSSGVEMYANARYFTMTGNRWLTCADEISVDNGILAWIHEHYIKNYSKETTEKSSHCPDNQQDQTSVYAEDEQALDFDEQNGISSDRQNGNIDKQTAIYYNEGTENNHGKTTSKRQPKPKEGVSLLTDDQLLETARSSKNGADFEALWQGTWRGKYKSHSEADFALCCRLAFWSNKDKSQIDRLFRKSGLYRKKWENRHHGSGATYGEQTVNRAVECTNEVYSPAKQRKPVSVFESGGCYYRKRGEQIIQLTNFIIHPIDLIISDDEAQMTCEFVTDNGDCFPMTLLADDFTNLQKFKKILNKRTISLCFFGAESDLEPFKHFLQSLEWVTKKGVKALGIYSHKRRLVFVHTKGAVAAGDVTVDTIVQLEKYRDLDSDILSSSIMTGNMLSALGEVMLSYNEPAKTAPILGWVAGCFIKPHLRRVGAKFPHLLLIGEQGGGKSTTLEQVILPVFGRSKVTASSQVTPFTLMRESCSSNIIPQAFDEFKPSKLDKFRLNALYNHFRDSYDFHGGIRGRADQTTVTYDLLAPIIVSGEENADEAAIRERTIELLFSKKDLLNAGYVDAFAKLSDHQELLHSFGRTLLDVTLRTALQEVKTWYDEGLDRYKGEFPTRIVSNLACVFAGLRMTERLCHSFDQPWNYVFPLTLDACANQLAFATKEYLLDGGNHNKSVVEQTFEVMSRMKLKAGVDFLFEAAGRRLCIFISGVYDRYTRFRRDYAILGEVLTYAQFKKQLEHSEYFIAKNYTKRFGETTKRVWVIDYEKLQRVADVSGFYQAEPSEEPNDGNA